jgi:hypothetical protein
VAGTNATEVLLDGKPVMKAMSPQIYTTPVGAGFMTIVTQGTPGTGIHFLTMGTQRIPGTDCPWSPGYSNIEFSPDGKHWAAACHGSSASYWVVVDGKKGQEYQTIQPAGFTADGRLVYGAGMRNQTFMVVGDQESDGYGSILSASDPMTAVYEKRLFSLPSLGAPAALAGNHVAFTAANGNGGTMLTVMVDGKALQRESAGRVIFNADGSHFGFTFGNSQSRTLNIDGKDLTGNVMTFQQPGNGRNRPRGEFVFSPDGRRVAYFVMQPNNNSAIYVDGKPAAVFAGSQPENLTFTPDGKHLLWLAGVSGSQIVYVDGRQALKVDGNSQIQLSPGAWEVGADGTLTVVSQAGDAIKRFRITPGADTSVDTIGK